MIKQEVGVAAFLIYIIYYISFGDGPLYIARIVMGGVGGGGGGGRVARII